MLDAEVCADTEILYTDYVKMLFRQGEIFTKSHSASMNAQVAASVHQKAEADLEKKSMILRS